MSRSGIHNHGNFEELVRAEASRYGWTASFVNQDIDPYESGPFGPKNIPGRGDVVLKPNTVGDAVSFEYHLPEDPEHIRATVRDIIEADKIERDRRSKPTTIEVD